MKYVTLFVFGAFCVLASYSYGVVQPYPMGVKRYAYAHAKPVVLYRDSKAALIADIWGIAPSELEKPIAIFGRD